MFCCDPDQVERLEDIAVWILTNVRSVICSVGECEYRITALTELDRIRLIIPGVRP